MSYADAVKFKRWMGGCVGPYRVDDGGCDTPWAVYKSITYLEYAVTVLFLGGSVVTTFGSVVGNLSVRLHGVLCILIEGFMLFSIPFRFRRRDRARFRDMVLFADGSDVQGEYLSAIRTIARYNLVASNVFVSVAALYATASDSVHYGDPFTFPFMDVLPVGTGNMAAYVCKYAVYALPVYIAHAEVSFLSIAFVFFVGVINHRCRILRKQVRDAVVDGDHQQMKIAIAHHQGIIKYFNDVKSLYNKSILLVTAFAGIYIGLAICVIILAMQGYVNKIILAMCVTSGLASLLNNVIYCFYASSVNDLHDKILLEFSNERLLSADKSFKQVCLVMMTRLSIPLQYEIGHVIKIDLNLLVKIIKFSYSWLNVLLASVGSRRVT